MIKRTLAVIVFASMVSCTDSSSDNKSEDVRKPANSTESATGVVPPESKEGNEGNPGKMCFANFDNSDTVIISFTKMNGVINGQLLYKFDEKDRNMGSIKGVMQGDTIIADYSFMSEGINSVRQVVFLKQGDEMVEGFGSVVDEHGKVVYQDLSKLTFDKSVILKTVNCEKFPAFN